GQRVSDILSRRGCGRWNSGGSILRKKGRDAQGARKNKSKQKSHELEFRHDQAGGCSNVTVLCRHATLAAAAFPTLSSRAQARDLPMSVDHTRLFACPIVCS